MKNIKAVALAVALCFVAVSCKTPAGQASQNLSTAADQFEVARRVVFVNGITDNYLLEVTGFCSIEDQIIQLEVTCQATDDERGFVKHFFGKSDNTPYFVEQLDPIDVSTTRPRIIFRPSTIIPKFEVD
jgi:hypothetical protein